MIFRVDLRPESVIIVSMNSEERMKSWKELDLCEQIPWETWKRLVANMGVENARLQAEKIIKKRLDKKYYAV